MTAFSERLQEHGISSLTRRTATTVQINVGKHCNQACHHCHVEAGPLRTERMSLKTVERILRLLPRSPSVTTVDITGGAPELNPGFRTLVTGARRLGLEVMDRCNLTVIFEPGMDWVPAFLSEHQVKVVASLPCYSEQNVDTQRGRGVFEKSIRALRHLNEMGYAAPGTGLQLDLVYNPVGPFLPPPQEALEADYKKRLLDDHGIRFSRLLTLTNMPIKRFHVSLVKGGKLDPYMDLLVDRFNPKTLGGLMCRDLVSVSWDGALYDCDFNQMLEIPAGAASSGALSIWDVDSFGAVTGGPIATAAHCFGCTAGAGSSCGGALG